MRNLILTMLLLAAAATPAAAAAPGREMARIPAGSYEPLFTNGSRRVEVAAFAIDRHPVTRAEFAAFLRQEPRWRRDRVSRAFAGPDYLASWQGGTDFGGAADARRPVTEVSWFAARSYCAAQGKRLPTTDEWEYVARASEDRVDASRELDFVQRLLTLYTSRHGAQAEVGSGFANVYGVADLHELAWEWVLDFNSLLVSDDSRATAGRDHPLFCAAGVIGATDPNNYPAFLRYGFRATLEGRTTTTGLGFRCAQGV